MKREATRWALITGASSGIGECLAQLLAAERLALILHGRNLEKLQELASKLSRFVEVEVVVADLSLPAGRDLVVEAIRKRKPEIVINNAGYGIYGESLDASVEEQLHLLEVNGTTVLQITLEAASCLKEEKKEGVILNVASVAGFLVFPCLAVYAAAKAFVISLSESLDEEWRPLGIRVLAACPGMVDTHFRERAGGTPDSSFLSMKAQAAAQEIWKQIQNKKQVHVFNWFYKLSLFFVRFILPKRLVASLLKKNIQKRVL